MRKVARLITPTLLAVLLTLGLAAPSHAGLCNWFPVLCRIVRDRQPPVDAVGAPEIDPGQARGVLTLVLGGLLILNERRRRS